MATLQPASIQHINFRVGGRSYGFRSGPRGQIIFVENLAKGEYQRISSYNIDEDRQNVVCLDCSKWVAAKCQIKGQEQIAMYKKINQFLDLFYMPE